jgi:hypothetical protein
VSLSLAGLDMPVLVPAQARRGDLTVTGTGKGRIGGSALEYWESVTVAPNGGADDPPPWTLQTMARRGCRPGGDGGWSLDSGLPGAADAAVGGLLLEQLATGLPQDELRRRGREAVESARAIARRLDDPDTWAQATTDVDGHTFMLWFHRRAEGFAAVADLGAVVLAAHGRTPPDAWTFRLLSPQESQSALGGRSVDVDGD